MLFVSLPAFSGPPVVLFWLICRVRNVSHIYISYVGTSTGEFLPMWLIHSATALISSSSPAQGMTRCRDKAHPSSGTSTASLALSNTGDCVRMEISGSRFARLIWAPDNLLYLVDNDPIELCDLCPRHPVLRQSADATELGDRYLAGLTPDRRRSPYLLRFRGRLDLRGIHRHHRRDREDTRLPSRLVLS
jgi:hypothetical protein